MAMAKCKFQKRCSYKFIIAEIPTEDAVVTVDVVRSGDYHHDKEVKKRHLLNTKRKSVAKDIKIKSTHEYYYEKLSNITATELISGNMTDPKVSKYRYTERGPLAVESETVTTSWPWLSVNFKNVARTNSSLLKYQRKMQW